MTTLQAADIARIRRRTGADDIVEMPSTEIQYYYDLAEADAPNAASILPYTYVYILRDLWGSRSTDVDRYTDHGDHEIRSQVRDATKKLLDYWEQRTGLTGDIGGGLQVGSLNLGIDYTTDDLEAGL